MFDIEWADDDARLPFTTISAWDQPPDLRTSATGDLVVVAAATAVECAADSVVICSHEFDLTLALATVRAPVEEIGLVCVEFDELKTVLSGGRIGRFAGGTATFDDFAQRVERAAIQSRPQLAASTVAQLWLPMNGLMRHVEEFMAAVDRHCEDDNGLVIGAAIDPSLQPGTMRFGVVRVGPPRTMVTAAVRTQITECCASCVDARRKLG